MRRLSASLLLLFAAACTDKMASVPTPGVTVPARAAEAGELIGLNAGQLGARFGVPALQVREGASVKLQYRGRSCILDAYLYLERSEGVQKVTHVDTRDSEGRDVDQRICIDALQHP